MMSDADVGGSTFLSELGTGAGNPPPAIVLTPQNGVDAAIQAAADGPPDYIPAKFWDGEKRQVRLEELGRGYINVEKLVGRDKIPVPLSDDDAEGWDRWYAASGRPDTSDGYELERPQLPAEMSYDEEGEKFLRTWAHQHGLSKRQTKALFNDYAKMQMERHAAYGQHQTQTKADLKVALQREYGPQFAQAMTSADMVMTNYGDPEFRKFLDDSGLGNDPRMLRFVARIGKDVSGDTRLKGVPVETGQVSDIDKAMSDHMRANEAVLMNPQHPDYAGRNAERIEFMRKRWGE